MKSGSLEVSRILMVFLYLFIYGAQSSRSDEGADFLLNLIGRLQAQHGQSPGEANANNEGGEGDDDDDDDEEDDEDSDDESDMENYEYEEGPTIFDPYGEEEDDDEAANNGEDEEYSDGLPRVGHNHDENYDESAELEDEMMMDFFEDDFVINDRGNAMDPVLLIAAAKNKLVPIERKGTVRRRDESQHEDEVEINESASPNKRRKLDDGYVDDKSIKRSNRDEYEDILPALMGDGNNNGDGGDGKRDDKKFNDIWNGNKSKSPKNRPNKDNKNNNSTNSNNNNNSDDDMPALVEDIDDDEPPQNQSNNSAAQQMFNNPNLLNALLAHRHTIRNRNSNSNDSNRTSGSDEDMPILIESDDEDEQPQRSSGPIEVNDDEDDLPELTSEEDSDDDEEFGFRQMFPNPSCPVHGGRPTCCEYHAQHGFSTDEDNSDDGDYDEDEDDEDEDEEMHDHDHLISAFHNALAEHFTNNPGTQIRTVPQRTSQSSSASSSLRQESPFLRGGASPTVSHHLHNSSASVRPGRKRRRADRDHEEYNEDYEVDVNKPVDVPPLVWSDDEGDEEDHEAEEISSDSEQVEEQTPEQKERFQRFLMANLTNAIMSNYLHTHEHEEVDSDDDDDEYLLDEDEDDEVVQSSPPFSFVPNPRLVQSSQAPQANAQGGFQFNFDQPFNPAVNRQGGFQFAPMSGIPQNMSFNVTQTSNNSVGPVFNFSSGQVQHQTGQHSVNITWNYSSNNSNGAQNNTNPHDHTDFDPNSLHDVD